jgi:soluble lytic murein transglycosylase-like protein
VLSRRSGNTLIADRAATAVLSESRRLRLSPSLVAAVLLVENTPMDTTALSVAGAVGLMQVMPVHGGAMGCASPDLLEVEANICHGTRVLKMYVRRTRTVQAALQRYHGCVGALKTRRCLRYPARVLRIASGIRREMLAAPAPVVPPSPPPPTYLSSRPQPAAVSQSLSSLLILGP